MKTEKLGRALANHHHWLAWEGGGESSSLSRASSRKPESQEGPRGQERGREHQSHGKGTGQGCLPARLLQLGQPLLRGLCGERGHGNGLLQLPGGAGGMEELVTAGQSPPSAEGETETPEEKSWPKARWRMTFHRLRGALGSQAGVLGRPRAAPTDILAESCSSTSAPSHAPETIPPHFLSSPSFCLGMHRDTREQK